MNSSAVYHVWFATKRRKWLLQGDVEERVREVLAQAAKQHRINLLAIGTMIDHVHLLIRLRDGEDLSKCMNLLKGITARRIFQEVPELKLDAQINHFWQKRFGSKLVPQKALHAVKHYIETQQERPDKYM